MAVRSIGFASRGSADSTRRRAFTTSRKNTRRCTLQPCSILASDRAGAIGGVDLLRVVLLTVIAVFLTGCVTGSGADYASLSQKIGAPKAGQARIVVFREKAFRGSLDGGYDIKL